MDSQSLAGFQSITDLAKQLITLATGILALSITFTKDILKNTASGITWHLKAAWITYLVTICFGIWTMMAVTGTIFSITENPGGPIVTYDVNIILPASLLIAAFLLATIFLIVFGAKTLRARAETPAAAVVTPSEDRQ